MSLWERTSVGYCCRCLRSAEVMVVVSGLVGAESWPARPGRLRPGEWMPGNYGVTWSIIWLFCKVSVTKGALPGGTRGINFTPLSYRCQFCSGLNQGGGTQQSFDFLPFLPCIGITTFSRGFALSAALYPGRSHSQPETSPNSNCPTEEDGQCFP